MLNFISEHFIELLLSLLAMGAWMGTMHLIHRGSAPAEDVAWAREQAATIIGALLMYLTGKKLAAKPPASSPPPTETKDATGKVDE